MLHTFIILHNITQTKKIIRELELRHHLSEKSSFRWGIGTGGSTTHWSAPLDRDFHELNNSGGPDKRLHRSPSAYLGQHLLDFSRTVFSFCIKPSKEAKHNQGIHRNLKPLSNLINIYSIWKKCETNLD